MKDNIMKMTDGMFSKIFDEIGAKYPDIQVEENEFKTYNIERKMDC
jgi:isocitrate/isopropylmalate dehydrogenase